MQKAGQSSFFPKSALSEKEADENGPLAYIKPIFYRSSEEDVPKIAAYAAIYFSEDAFEEILKKDSSLKGEFSFLINDDLDLVAASDISLFQVTLQLPLLSQTRMPADSFS